MGQIDSERVPRGGPWLALIMRGSFALLSQTVVAAGFRLAGRSQPWRAATAGWMVHSSLADVVCLAVLRWLLRREGKTLGDLLDLDRGRLNADMKDAALDVGPLAVGAGISSALQRPFYPRGLPPQITVVRVPRWAQAYGVLI